MNKDEIDKLNKETEIYAWHTNDRKQDKPDMSVDFIFPPFTDVEEAIKQVNQALEGSGLSYQMRTWTMLHEDNYLEE